jgi:O-antigen/teichoic acid export membrane protein
MTELPEPAARSDGTGAFWMRPAWLASARQAYAALLLGTGLSFAATLLVARTLDRPAYGAILLAVSTVGSITALLDVSLEEAVVHFGAASEERDDPPGVLALFRASAAIDLLVGVGVFAALMVLAGPIASAVSGGALNPGFIRLSALEAFVLTINGTTGAALLLTGRPHLRAWSMAAGGALRLVAVAAALAVATSGSSVLWAYVIGSASWAILQAIVAWWSVRRRWPGTHRGALPVGRRRLLRFGAQSSITTTVVAVETGLIAAILGREVGAQEVAVFSIALFPVVLAALATAPVRMTTFPELARLAAGGDTQTLWRGIVLYTRLALALGAASAAIGWFMLDRLIPALYSHRYEDAVGPARVLLVAAVASLCTAWAKALPAAVGRPGIRTIVSLVEVALTVSLTLWWASRGAAGAAMALTVASVVIAGLWLLIARRVILEGSPGRSM